MGHIDSERETRHAITEVIASTNGEDIREATRGSTFVRPGRYSLFTFANCDKHAFLRLISHLAHTAAFALNFHFARRMVRVRTKPRRVDAVA
jgi:hypothetical protein